MQPLAEALRTAHGERRPISVPYVLVDRARSRSLDHLLRTLAEAGASAVELGFPFSDPIADGPLLAAAADRALRHGTGWSDLVEQVRRSSRLLPTAVMTYANPVWRHGLDRGVGALARAGASGLIVPDLSLEEARPWERACRRHGMALVLLAAPAASPERVAAIARRSRGFLYMVSRFGTTGTGADDSPVDLRALLRAAHRARPELPVLLGFGVKDAATARAARASGADGVVVGSALEERLGKRESLPALGRWFRGLANAVPRRG